MRHSRLKSSLTQMVLVLFALLSCLAPALAAAPIGVAEDHLCAPAAPRADMAGLSVGIAADAEEEPDEPDAGFADAPIVALESPPDAEDRRAEAVQTRPRRLPGPFGTGPPTL